MRTPTKFLGSKDFPVKIYKYMERKYAEELCNYGKIRVLGLRSYESDPGEGSLCCDIDQLSSKDVQHNSLGRDTILRNLDPAISGLESSPGSEFENCTIETCVPNWIVYCASTEKSHKTMEACDSRYDSCVEISNISGFVNQLTIQLAKVTKESGSIDSFAGYCTYLERNFPIRRSPPAQGVEIAFVKPPTFEAEHEYRILWKVELEYGAARFIESPEICKYCRLIEVPA